jgi:AraC-like DNA-binding protein
MLGAADRTIHDRIPEMLGRSSDPPAADALSEVLQDLRVSGASYGRCELASPWGIDFPAQREARFHFVARGRCWLRSPEKEWIALEAGDVVLLPHGAVHALADAVRQRTKPIDEFPLQEIGERTYLLSAGGSGARTILACCSVSFEEPAVHPLLELMPPMLLVRNGATNDPSLPALLETMSEEMLSHRVGAAGMMRRLADVVITRVIRAWVESRRADTSGWLAAIRDPKIGRALAAIHRRPGEPWSLDALADVARISRSRFAERFAAVLGMPPAQYLARWRMHLAAGWLRNDRLTVAEVATRLAYESEASFSRAFKRSVGVPPSALRRADTGKTWSRARSDHRRRSHDRRHSR